MNLQELADTLGQSQTPIYSTSINLIPASVTDNGEVGYYVDEDRNVACCTLVRQIGDICGVPIYLRDCGSICDEGAGAVPSSEDILHHAWVII